MQQIKKVLVTGANGYIGRHVVTELINRGTTVIAVDTNTERLSPNANPITNDIFSGESDFYQKIGSPDVCIHLAWKDSFSHNSDSHMTFLSHHFNFVNDLINAGLPHLTVMGSMHEVGYHEGVINEFTPCNPISLYAIAKDALRRSLSNLTGRSITVFQWLRGFYVFGDDENNHSVFTKIIEAEKKGEKNFPFTSGNNLYDFIHVSELAKMIVASALQEKITGIINCCSGKPVRIGDQVESFLKEKDFHIKLAYGAFKDRPYDSPAIWGDNSKIQQILQSESHSDNS